MSRALIVPLRLLCLGLMLSGPIAHAQSDSIPALNARITDTTGTLDAAATQRIEAPLVALETSKGSQIAVLIVPTTGAESIEAYAVRAFEQWKLGRKGVDDGVLLVVAKNDRNVRIEVGYGLEGAIPDVTAHRVIQEYLVPRFREGDFAGGIEAAVGVLAKLVEGEALPAPVSANAVDTPAFDHHADDDLIGMLPLLAIPLIVLGVFLRQMVTSLLRRGLIGGSVVAILAGVLFGLHLFYMGIGFVVGFLFAIVETGKSSGGHARSGSWGGYGGGSSSSRSGGGGWSGGGGRSGGGGASGSW